MSGTPYSRMLSLGSREGSTPIEDFLTEALAAATNRDPRPLVAALRKSGIKLPGEPTAATQVVKESVGRLDLVLSVDGVEVVWVEVKAWSGEHGDQLRRYTAAAAKRDPQPIVLMLATAGAVPSITMPRLTWHKLVEAINDCEKPSDLWIELQDLIEERGFGGGLTMPLTADEAQSFQYTQTGIAKVAAFINELEGTMSTLQSHAKWIANIDRMQFITDQVQRHGRAIYQFDPIARPSNSIDRDPLVFMWVGVDGRRLRLAIEGRAKVNLKTLLQGSFGKLQTLHWKSVQENILQVIAPPSALTSEEKAIAWSIARIAEIESTGAYSRIRSAAAKGGIKYYNE
jgi:hypothetical protein